MIGHLIRWRTRGDRKKAEDQQETGTAKREHEQLQEWYRRNAALDADPERVLPITCRMISEPVWAKNIRRGHVNPCTTTHHEEAPVSFHSCKQGSLTLPAPDHGRVRR